MNNLSPQLQNQVVQFQQLQQQLQTVSTQKVQMDAQKKEIERTLEELAKAKDDIYRSVGSLLIKVDDREALKAELTDATETIDVRLKAMERQEKTLREKYQSLQETINKAMGQQ